jgi:ferric enterobactin receptor
MQSKIYLFLILNVLTNLAFAQQRSTISGTIKDAASGEPLPFVTVQIPSAKVGTTANVDGYFSFMNVADTSTIQFSYIGYKTKSMKLTTSLSSTNILVELNNQSNALDEVTVTAEREELLRASEKISMLKMTPAKIAALPSIGEKDIFRAFQLMPGVSAANENSSGLFVRGGTPDQTLVLYDGFNVYHVEHLFGFYSAFNPNAIKDMQLYKGGFEAKYGGRIGAVAEITSKDGDAKRINGGLDIGLIAANGYLEVPIGNKFSSSMAFRRSYPSPLYTALFNKFSGTASAASNDGRPPRKAESEGSQGLISLFSTTVASYFYDANAKFTYKPTKNDVISLSFYNGTDNLDNSRTTTRAASGTRPGFDQTVNDVTKWGNFGSSLKWSHRFSPRFYMNTLVSYSNYYSQRDRRQSTTSTNPTTSAVTTNSRGTLEDNLLYDYSVKANFEYKINKDHFLEFGLNETHNKIDYVFTQNDTLKVIDRHTNGDLITGFVQDKITLFDKLEVIGGLRLNYFTPTSKFYIEPRLSASYQLFPKVKLKAAWGIYDQFAKRVIREDVLQGSRDFWVLSDNDKLPVASATHYILGASYDTKNWFFDIETYHKQLTGLTEYSLRIQPRRQVVSFNEYFFQGKGFAQGIDVLVQKKYGKLNGWVSYSLGQVKYNFPDFQNTSFFAGQDVRHELKTVAIYKVGQFDLSATWIFTTGRPYTAPEGGYQVTLLDGTQKSYINVSDKNGLRLPNYNRLDAAVTFHWKPRKHVSDKSVSLCVFNAYNRKNVWYKEYEVQNNSVIATNVTYLGITPNLSFSWKFK